MLSHTQKLAPLKKRVWLVSNGRQLLPASIIALPLFTLVGSAANLTFNLRLSVVLILTLFALVYYWAAIKQVLRQLPRPVLVSLLVFVFMSIISSLHSIRFYPHAALLGSGSDQLGLVVWLCFLVIGLCAIPVVKQAIFSPKMLYILLPVGAVSLLMDHFSIRHGLRLSGLLYQSTSMAIYACLAVIIACTALYKQLSTTLRIIGWLVLLIYSAIVILTQSRIGWLCLLIVLAVNGWLCARKRISVSIFACLGILLIFVLPFGFHNYFSRFGEESVTHGSSYRLDMYKTASKDIFQHNLVFGKGTDTLPAGLNDPHTVPEDIAKTLDQGYLFASAHNTFIDLAYYFGVVASIALLVVLGYAARTFIRAHDYSIEALNYLLLCGVLCMNALLNVPSIELTPLFFIILFGLFSPRLHGKTK